MQRHYETANAAGTYDQIRAIAQPGQRHSMGVSAGYDRPHLVHIGWHEQKVCPAANTQRGITCHWGTHVAPTTHPGEGVAQRL